MIGTGRVCGTSASRAPSVTTISTSSRSAASMTAPAKLRHFRFGSTPDTKTRSRSALGTSAVKIVLAGQSTSRASPSAIRIVGRVTWKS